MALRQTLKLSDSGLMGALGRWARNAAGHRKLGLYSEDLIMEELPGVEEALTRLPEEVLAERYFRLRRAFQLSITKDVLPKEHWVTEDNDVKYLSPMVDTVLKELKDKEEFDFKI
eukprot:m.15979 g.15979  ORF g.15979 m.15979 type:complete len:115 (-) comp4552_c0_seq1:1056-1400(-)